MKENLEKYSSQLDGYSLVFSILILSLLLPVRYLTPFFLIRPFDILTALIFLYWIFSKNNKKEKIAYGYFYLFPFLIFHALSALTVDGVNFLRELLQIVIIIIFAFLLSEFREKIDYKKTINYLLVGAISIMVFTIFWHFFRGIWVGWKQLDHIFLH